MPDETAELHNYIPAGSATCCCEQAAWLGRRARGPVLTDAFVRSAVRGGSIIPPQDGPEPLFWRGVRNLLIIVGLCIATAWSVVHFWPV